MKTSQMNEQPLVSIIIPTYNRAHLIGQTLDSVLIQTYQNWECIIVDDRSSDNTDEVIAAYIEKDSRFKHFHCPEEHLEGGNGARNYGFKMSEGDYVQWFDSDDLMLPEKLEFKIRLARNNNLDMVICSGISAEPGPIHLKDKIVKVENDLFESYCTWKSQIMLPSVMFRKGFLKDKRLFNERLTRSQENEFFSRIFFDNDFSFELIKEPLYIYIQHNENKKSEQKSSYRPDYIYSFSYVSLENLKRGLEIKNKRIVNHHLKRLIELFFTSYHKSDFKNFRFIYSNLPLKKIEHKKRLIYLLKICYSLFRIRIQIPYKIEMKIKSLT